MAKTKDALERAENYSKEDFAAARMMNIACTVKNKILKLSGVSDERIKDWKEREYIVHIDSAKGDYWRTTIAGRKEFSTITGMQPYVAQSLTHNSKLAIVFDSKTESEQKSWITEAGLKSMMELNYERFEKYAKDHDLTMDDFSKPDGAYISEATGELTFCEVVTRFYTQEMIDKKINFCNALGSRYEQHKA